MIDMVNSLAWRGRFFVGLCLGGGLLLSSGARRAESSVGGGGGHFSGPEKPTESGDSEPVTDGGVYSENPDAVVINGRTVNPGRLIGKWKGDVAASEGVTVVEAMGLRVAQTFASVPLVIVLEPVSRDVIGAANYVPLDTADAISRQIRELLSTGFFEYVEPDWTVGGDGPDPSQDDQQVGHGEPGKEGDDPTSPDGGDNPGTYPGNDTGIVIDGRRVNPGRLFAKWKSDLAATTGRSEIQDFGLDVAGTFASIPLLVVLEPLPLDVVGVDDYVPLDSENGIREQISRLLNTGWFEYVEPDWAVEIDGSQTGEGGGSVGIGGGESPGQMEATHLSIRVDAAAGVLVLEHEEVKSAQLQVTSSLLNPVWKDIDILGEFVTYTFLGRTQWRIETASPSGFYRLVGE